MAELIIDSEDNTETDLDLNTESFVNELPEEDLNFENIQNEDLPEDITDDISLSEIDEISEISELEEVNINELIQNSMLSTGSEATEEQEILQDDEYIKSISENIQVIMQNQKVQAENNNLLSGVGLCVQCMFFGGFIIFCFLHRLG